jgi:hypothetical protein
MFDFLTRCSQGALTKALAASFMLAIAPSPAQSADPAAEPIANTIANTAVANRLPSRATSRRPRPPRRLPPNQVQPGGGLDVSARSCAPNSSALTALVPVENPVFTASAHPTFLFYLPDDPEQIEYAEFILLGADEKEEIYATQFVPTSSGVVSLSLPAQPAYALEVDQPYHWYLNLHCKTAKAVGESIPTVNGWVQRLNDAESLNSLSELESLTETEVPELWYDAIAQVAQTQSTGPTAQSQLRWQNWLSAVGLDEVVNVPVLGPVLPE